LSLGKNLDKALLNAELLDKVAQIYCLALSTGKTIHTLPDSTIEMIMAVRNYEVNDAQGKKKVKK
jgi:ribulose-5-phosphate 4-epimerase/fuculose-1-phosphate aldolase